jgi:hypothetical protein
VITRGPRMRPVLPVGVRGRGRLAGGVLLAIDAHAALELIHTSAQAGQSEPVSGRQARDTRADHCGVEIVR